MRRGSILLSVCFLLIAMPAAAETPLRPGDQESRQYRIGIEDQLQVVVWGEAELSHEVKVRPDGKITLPLLNDIHVVGMTPDEVRARITESLGQFVREPSVTVIVQEINSFRVYFLGEVNQQGAVQFYGPTRVLQAIATVGGLTEFAKKEVTLLREVEGHERRTEIDYKRLLAGDPSAQNIYLEPGDTLLFR